MTTERRLLGGVFFFQSQFWWGCGVALLITSWLNASHYRPWLNFQSELMAFLGLATLAAAHGQRWQLSSIELPRSALVAAGVCLVPLGQWMAGLTPFGGDLFINIAYLLAFATAFVLGWGVVTSGALQRLNVPGIVLWLPALASAVVGLLQWLNLSWVLGTFAAQTDVGDRPMGNMAQTNQMGTLMLLGMVGAWHDFRQQRIGRLATLLLIAFLTMLMLLTQSRTALLSGSVLAIYLACKSRREYRYAVIAWIMLIWLMAGAGVVSWLNDTLALSSNREIALVDPNSRQVLWRQMAAAIADSPWAGYGWNQTPAAHKAGALALPGELSFSYAHNLFLDLIAWCGIPLGLVICGLIAWWAITTAIRCADPTGVAAVAALIPIGVHSLLEFPFAYSYFLITAGLLAGVADAHQRQTASPRLPSVRLHPGWLTSAGLGSILLAAYVAWEYQSIEEDFRVVRFENMRIGQVPTDHAPASVVVLTQLQALVDASRTRAAPGMPPRQMELLQRAATLYAYPPISYRYALALALNGQTDAARQQFQVIRGVYGQRYYQAVRADFDEQARDVYPQLRHVLDDEKTNPTLSH